MVFDDFIKRSCEGGVTAKARNWRKKGGEVIKGKGLAGESRSLERD